jgi:hypothetical protein
MKAKKVEEYLKSFKGFWNEFQKLPEGFRFLVLNNMANYADEKAKRELAEAKRKANFAIIALSISNIIAICALLYRYFTF